MGGFPLVSDVPHHRLTFGGDLRIPNQIRMEGFEGEPLAVVDYPPPPVPAHVPVVVLVRDEFVAADVRRDHADRWEHCFLLPEPSHLICEPTMNSSPVTMRSTAVHSRRLISRYVKTFSRSPPLTNGAKSCKFTYMSKPHEATVIVGTKPVGSCTPDGSHIWVTRQFRDGRYDFTKFDGWLIAEETTTTDPNMATLLEETYKGLYR